MRTIDDVRKLFQYGHLPEGKVRDCSQGFHDLACSLFEAGPTSPELTKALNDLWQAKNWAVANVIQNGNPANP